MFYGWLPKCINTKFVCNSTTVYKLGRYAKLPNSASTRNPIRPSVHPSVCQSIVLWPSVKNF